MGQVRVDELDNGSPYLGWPGDPAGWGEGLEVAIDDARASVILPATGPAWGLSGRAILQTGFLIDAEAQGPGSLARILYQAAREVRMAQRTAVACWVPPGRRAWLQGLGFQPVPGLSTPDGSLQLFAADVGSALYRLAGEAASGGQAVPASVLVDEIGQTLERFFERIWETPWFRSVFDQSLSQPVYVYSLGNFHQFVRFTTRLLGRAVSCSDDTFLRAHFARHLREEINHELIIEADLEALGVDAGYVRSAMAPNPDTRRFMAAQESAVGFHQDPLLMLAAPLAAEGIAGRLDGRFVEALHANLARWGIDEPRRATRFFTSHIEFDGGDDGHWAHTVSVLERYIQDEAQLQQFLSFLAVTTSAMEGCYNSWCTDLSIFSGS